MIRLCRHSHTLMLLGFVVLTSGSALAQSNNMCKVQYQFFCGDTLLPGTLKCTNEGPCLDVCELPSHECAPASAPDETCSECSKANSSPQPQATQPINLANGNTWIKQADISVPGLGGGLALVRTWNSKWPPSQSAFRMGVFGPNWRSTFEERIFVGPDGYIRYSRSDGTFWSFGYSGTSSDGPKYLAAAPANEAATVSFKINNNWTLTFQNGETRVFDIASGHLTSITDRNGNRTRLSYDSSSRLTSITEPASRHLYFSYNNPYYYYLVTNVSSDVGVSLSYAYDDQGRLVTVTKPDHTTTSFQYDSNSLISAVLDSNGKVLESHTYDSSGRGLTSSRAGGAESVTVSYPSQSPPH
jgi:YD repeat-containing protein